MKVDELRALIGSMGFHTKPTAKDLMFCCPFHGETNPSMGVSVVKQGHPWGCFACGIKGRTVVSFISQYLSINTIEAQVFANKFGIVELPDEDYILDREEFRERQELEFQHFVEENYDETYIPSRGRLRYHNLPDKILREAKIGYDTLSGAFIAPWPKPVGRGRFGFTFHGGSEKIKTRPLGMFNFKEHLYHPFPSAIHSSKEIVVVEGMADALAVACAGHRNVVAIAGTILTDKQAAEFKRLSVSCVITLFDPDFAGRKVILDFTSKLGGLWVFEGRLEKNDPADSSKEEIKSAIRDARLII
jgi:DNA primase